MGIGSGADLKSSGELILGKLLKKSFINKKRHLCVFDVGANAGQFTKMAIKELQNIPVLIHAFEPRKKAFEFLCNYSKTFPNVLTNNLALGKAMGLASLHYSESGSTLASLTKRRLDHYKTEVARSEIVRIDTIDNYCRVNCIPAIDLLKIDVEGHELDVLRGAIDMFQSRRIQMVSFKFGGCNIDTRTFFQEFWYFFAQFREAKIYRITPSGHLARLWKYKEAYEQFQTTNFLVSMDLSPEPNKVIDTQGTFDYGMQFSSAYFQTTKPELWIDIKKRFLEFENSKAGSNQIPKKLHQIWLGSELPAHYELLIKKLKELHPNWEYKLWTDKNIDFDLINTDLFQRAENMGQKSDILRYEILNRFGGVYLDLDHEATNRFDSLLALDSFAGVTYDFAPQLTNSVIGSRPKSALTERLCQFDSGFVDSPSIKEVFDTTGPDYFTRIFLSLLPKSPKMVAFPNAYFSPYPNFPRDRVLGNDFKNYLQKDTICCHLWHCSWIKK